MRLSCPLQHILYQLSRAKQKGGKNGGGSDILAT